MKKITRKMILPVLLLSTLVFAGCSSQKNDSTEKSETKTDALDHKVAIPNNPKRIIGSYLEDYLVALDVKPVAQWTVGSGSIQTYLQEGLKDVPTINFDLPYEDVLSFEPDLLLIESNSMVEGGKYAEYNKIAPTYVVKNGEDVTWQEKLKDIADVLDKSEQGDQVITDYEALVKQAKEELKDKIAGKSAAVLWVTNNSAFMVAENRSSGNLLYDQLGFEVPNLTKEISQSATSDWSAVSLEKLAQLDADYLILVNSDTGAAMFDDQIWQNIPAVKNNHLWEFGPESSWLYNGPIAYTQMVEDIQEKLN
ncbi:MULTISPECIES: ABC transporter substrate-binding protein [Enterococcus]|uniref:ABC transporter substrate-binding protein n=1 Tax=Enterococcus TaxID=1350 RepID=UPI0010F52DF7|nr:MULTISPECIES: ABC transporter substrate-binding protein [Enterococcus]KAF1304245.1 ferrichrome ABC transporter substrate-binding protein [Enterococcus sp. JM9B]